MKIKLTDNGYGEHVGKIIEALHIDKYGDANVNKDDHPYNGAWILKDEYEVVDEEPEEVVAQEEFGYTLTIQVKDLLELHDILGALPSTVVERTYLDKN